MIGAHHQGNGDIGIKHNLFLHPSKLVTSNVSNRPLKVCSSEIWNSSLRMLVSSGNYIDSNMIDILILCHSLGGTPSQEKCLLI